jgi:small subunit ribosomal protein S20
MANTFSAIKRVRVTEHRTAVNRMRRTRMRTAVKSIRKLINLKKADEATQMLPEVFSIVDRAAKWGVIKKNTAARYKSRVTAAIRRLAVPAA